MANTLVKPAGESARDVLPFPWIQRIFQRLGAMYGERFHKQWGNIPVEEVMQVWAQDLGDYSATDIAAGLTSCKLRDWPPTLPEFLKLCRPWMNPEVAYHEAVVAMSARQRGETGQWSHPAVYWAATRLGAHDLLTSTYGAVKARWERFLGDELSKDQWPDIPAPCSALPAPGKTQATRQEAEAALKRMGADKVLSQKSKDPRRWARVILDNQASENGKRYTPAMLAMARAALS